MAHPSTKGERKAKEEVKSKHNYRHEMYSGAFTRTVTLPQTADVAKSEATFENGVVTVSFPKLTTVEPKRIAIKSKELESRHDG